MYGPLYRGNSKILLVDTPGFDSSMETDIYLLGQFVQFLKEQASQGVFLSGIIYLHRISDMKMGGSARKNLQLLREFCGNQFLERVTLVSTMWDIIQNEVGFARERNLTGKYWAEMIGLGAVPLRYDGTEDSALRVIDRYLERELLGNNVKSDIEREAVQIQMPPQETGAGRFILGEPQQEPGPGQLRRGFERGGEQSEYSNNAPVNYDQRRGQYNASDAFSSSRSDTLVGNSGNEMPSFEDSRGRPYTPSGSQYQNYDDETQSRNWDPYQ
jgi:hypothetical protein